MGRSSMNTNRPTRTGGRCAATLSLLLSVVTCLAQMPWHVEGTTTIGFYARSCPNAETIIQQEVQSCFNSDPTISAGLLRMFFHDCFIQRSSYGRLHRNTEVGQREDRITSLRNYDNTTVDAPEPSECPGLFSCADIIAVATRDAVALAGGPSYQVKTGRFDGRRSKSSDANILPSPDSDVDQARSAFASQGLSLNDFVVLLGAHTTGFAHCGFFSDRLYNFQGTGQPDPTMNPSLVNRLKGVCPNPASGSSTDPTVSLDQGTRDTFDSSYYSQLQKHNGILRIDQVLQDDPRTSPLVSRFTDAGAFSKSRSHRGESVGRKQTVPYRVVFPNFVIYKSKIVNVPFYKNGPKITRIKRPHNPFGSKVSRHLKGTKYAKTPFFFRQTTNFQAPLGILL
ncbi:hypothetical protein KP509_35G020500 [Ceratopteris richardii]|uniref:Peroxidase n=1 Tax=Ceratopteris richardii TaxID=49495 RepID=A0A8T2QGF7_CERRI|nr:hypothetical protein KP509_35G020500 [Ceratopteris richardii]